MPLALPHLSGPIIFDGLVDEPAWEAVEPLPATQNVPTFGAAPSEQTEFRVAYDDQYLYFSCRAWDSDPEGIRAVSLQRDTGDFANDWCVINLDTFDDKETALIFGTTPAGLRTDLVFANDATGGPNFDWNTFWDAAVHRDQQGFSVQHSVPGSALFDVGGSVEAGGYYDGRRVSFSLSPLWRVSKHLALSGTYRLDDIRFGSRAEGFRAHIGRVRAQFMADTRLSFAALVQYNSATDLVSANLRLRFNPSEGHDLYVVWNQRVNTDRYAYDPVRPLTDQRTLLVKYSRTLTLGF